MHKTEHIRRLLAGDATPGPAVGCWYHFPPQSHSPEAAAEAHLRHLQKFDLDFLKVMNEVDYPRDALGPTRVIQDVADLTRLQERPGDGPPFDRQLEIIDRLARQVGGQVPMTTTVFHAWMVLRTLLAPPKDLHRPPVIEVRDDPRDTSLTRFLREDRPAVAAALQAIGRTLANFARACLQAGADGIYLATRDDWVDTPANRETTADADVYDELVAETDREILSAAATGWFNVLHLCGRPLRFDRQISHPNIHVIHWADRVTGPAMADACSLLDAAAPSDRQRRPVPAGGVNNLSTLARGRPAAVAAEVHNAIAAAGEGPLIVAPGCTYDPDVVPDENIHAMVAAARRPRRQ